MIAAGVQFADPGLLGFAVGGLLIGTGLMLLPVWLRWSARRARAERVAEVGPVYAVGVAKVPPARDGRR